MSLIVVSVASLLLLHIAFEMKRQRTGRIARAWRGAAKDLGVRFEPEGLLRDQAITGTIGGFEVRIDATSRQSLVTSSEGSVRTTAMEHSTRIIVDGRGRFPDVFVGSRSLHAVPDEFRGREVWTGDEAFDEEVLACGDPAITAALLDRPLRQVFLRGMPEESNSLGMGKLQIRVEGLIDDRKQLVSWVRSVIDFAGQVVVPQEEIVEKLARNSVEDPVLSVRVRNLALLVERYGGTETASRTCRALLVSEDPALRLLAAKHLGPEGVETVRSMANDEAMTEEVRCEALRSLGESGLLREALPVLERALSEGTGPVLRAAIEAIGRLGYGPAIDRLIAIGEGADGETVAAVADALGKIGDPTAEPPLLQWLEYEALGARIAAARALARVGTAAAVEPLLAHAKGILANGELKHVCREALARIRERLGEAGPGRLSLSELDREDGALSLAEETGRLSVAGGAEAGTRRAKASESG